MSEFRVYLKGKKRQCPEGFFVDPAIAARLGLKNGQTVTRETVVKIMNLAIAIGHAAADRAIQRKSVNYRPEKATAYRRGAVVK